MFRSNRVYIYFIFKESFVCYDIQVQFVDDTGKEVLSPFFWGERFKKESKKRIMVKED